MRALPDKSIDLTLSDPPYDLSKEMIETAHKEIMRVSKAAIIFSPPENQWLSPSQYGFWVKPISTKNTSKRYSRFVEMIFFYGDLAWNTDRHWSQYTNVFQDLVDGDTEHPYEKPISLIKRLILNHSNPGDIILDPYAGSCTTGVVCKMLGRNFIMVENEKEYYDSSVIRLSKV